MNIHFWSLFNTMCRNRQGDIRWNSSSVSAGLCEACFRIWSFFSATFIFESVQPTASSLVILSLRWLLLPQASITTYILWVWTDMNGNCNLTDVQRYTTAKLQKTAQILVFYSEAFYFLLEKIKYKDSHGLLMSFYTHWGKKGMSYC